MIMKKLIVFILSVLYLTTTNGTVINFHYCKGKLSSVKLKLLTKNLCDCQKQSSYNFKKINCCKTEFKVIKISNLHKASIANYEISLPNKLLKHPSYYIYFSLIKYLNSSLHYYFINKLFLIDDLYILNRVLRI